MACKQQLGLELNEYLWPMPADQLQLAHTAVARMVKGMDRLIMHGTIPSPDLDILAGIDLSAVRRINDQAYGHAQLHNIRQLVFHSGFVPGKHDPVQWLNHAAAFWRAFLASKPPDIVIYVENMVDDDPKLLKELCDEVADSRLRLCLDVGHAYCNSSHPVHAWIETLGERIRHLHLHNNDGQRDRHWPLNEGLLDMDAVLKYVSHYAPDATYTLECNFEPSLNWLEQHGYLV